VRAGDLDQLQRIAAGTPSRARFLTDLTFDPPSATSDEASKRLEFLADGIYCSIKLPDHE
jgi:DNA helicase II / ATP-dependent DNA helicase PcrA